MGKRQPRLFLIAGESSGDQLGAELMREIKLQTQGRAQFSGVGGMLMQAEGLSALYPSSEIALMGPVAILTNFPLLLRRLKQTVEAIVQNPPDILVVIDSPEFTQRVAARVRKRLPQLPIIKYVAPQVWAWRPKRAKKMRSYIDEVLALLPFEPKFYKDLEGPKATYVGHPLMARKDLHTLTPEDQRERRTGLPVIAVLPGSRSSEVKRLLVPFGETLKLLAQTHSFQAVLPVVPHLRSAIEAEIKTWNFNVTLIEGQQAKWTLFRRAHAALAASGTVTLELALAKVPMVVAYKVENWMAPILRRILVVNTIVLPNLILGKKVVPEFYQADVNPKILSKALSQLMSESPQRKAQLDAFTHIQKTMMLKDNANPATIAAGRVLSYLRDETGT